MSCRLLADILGKTTTDLPPAESDPAGTELFSCPDWRVAVPPIEDDQPSLSELGSPDPSKVSFTMVTAVAGS